MDENARERNHTRLSTLRDLGYAASLADLRACLGEISEVTMALIFQYGSNCSESQINSEGRLRGDARFVSIARTVEDYRLASNVYSSNRGCAAADIVPSPRNKVWGVLYEIPSFLIEKKTAEERGRKSLDQIEGKGKNYQRHYIEVESPDGKAHTATTYRVTNPQVNLPTSLEYVRYIVDGLREHGAPADYIASVKEIACTNNPSIATQVAGL